MQHLETRVASHVRIRSAANADLDAIVQIETACFERAWTRQDYLAELDREASRIALLCRAENEQIIAFLLCWEVSDEVHILRTATLPSSRRQGHARRLLEHVIRDSRSRGRQVVRLEVGSKNEPAMQLYRGFGFAIVGRRSGYYQDGQDALLLDLQL